LIFVTNDYGCGTSSSILDYGIKNVCIVSPDDWEKVFDLDDDLFLVGHDVLLYMWDTQEKVDRWKKFQHAKIVWCFERVDAIIDSWLQKSHFSMNMIKQFADKIYACDEDDCDNYGFAWLPQWASRRFFDLRHKVPSHSGILFSGQAAKIEYNPRTELLNKMLEDPETSSLIKITNVSRNLSWDQYIDNFLDNTLILNPVGVVKALNTRAFEAIYSGRILLQHTAGSYLRHEEYLSDINHVIFFKTFDELKHKLKNIEKIVPNPEYGFDKNNLYQRCNMLEIK
jgi:hypothetical protein